MSEIFTIIPVAVAAYLATNLDNLTLLGALLARYQNRVWTVSLAYLACMLILGLVSFWIGLAAVYAPVEYLGFLGFIPISIGLVGLIQFRRGAEEAITENGVSLGNGTSIFFAALLSQLGNGADTVATFAALFADSTAAADVLIALCILVMSILFVMVAIYAVRHPALSKWIERYANRLMPYILIIVGAYIVANTATDLLPG